MRRNLQEATRLPDALYGPLDAAIASSAFWHEPNTEESADMNNVAGEWHNQSPAAELLGLAVKDHLALADIPITIIVLSAENDANPKLDLPVRPGHKLYPSKLVVGGEQSVSDNGRFVMYLNMVPVVEDFDSNLVNGNSLSQKIGNIVRHELIHSQHFDKRRRNQKTSRMTAKDRFEAEGEIVDSKDRSKYLGSRIEIDAYAHEFAEELLQKFGKDKALGILRGSVSVNDSELPETYVEYLNNVPGKKNTVRLKKKMYSHIMDLIQRGMYERVIVVLLQSEDNECLRD
jgi:hypothetical protein